MDGLGETRIVDLAPTGSLLAVLAELLPIDDDFPDLDDPLPEPVEL